MKAVVIGTVLLLATGVSSLAPALAQPTQHDWHADRIAVSLSDPADDVRLETTDDDVPDSYYRKAELLSSRISIKRVGRTPTITVEFHAAKVYGANATIRGHRVLQYFDVEMGKTPDLIHAVGFEATNRNDRISTFKDLEVPHRCSGAHRKIDTVHDDFTITLPLKCLKWTGWRWARISTASVLFASRASGKGVDDTDFTRALPLTAK